MNNLANVLWLHNVYFVMTCLMMSWDVTWLSNDLEMNNLQISYDYKWLSCNDVYNHGLAFFGTKKWLEYEQFNITFIGSLLANYYFPMY
jgi:hypothetical protein